MLTVDAVADIPAVARARGNNHGRQASRRAGKQGDKGASMQGVQVARRAGAGRTMFAGKAGKSVLARVV